MGGAQGTRIVCMYPYCFLVHTGSTRGNCVRFPLIRQESLIHQGTGELYLSPYPSVIPYRSMRVIPLIASIKASFMTHPKCFSLSELQRREQIDLSLAT